MNKIKMNMKYAVLLAAAALLAAVPAAADEVVRTLDRQLSAADVSAIRLDFPVGGLRVEAGGGRQVQVEVKLQCESKRESRCLEAARKVELVSTTTNDRLHIGLKGWPKRGSKGLEGRFVVTVPRDLPLNVDLGVGEALISGLESDLNVDVGVGEVKVTLPEAAVARVKMDTGVGEANLYAGGRRWESSGFVGKELSWKKGQGRSVVNIDCGVGEASVRLE